MASVTSLDKVQTISINTFLGAEAVHYLLGLIGCTFFPQAVSASFFPSNVQDCDGAHYVIKGVLAPFYFLVLVGVTQAIKDNTYVVPLAKMMLSFFFILLVGDFSDWMNDAHGAHWTKSKYLDASIHVFLLAAYLLVLRYYNPPSNAPRSSPVRSNDDVEFASIQKN